MKKYYKCFEFKNIWSYRENTNEQLIIVLIDKKEKCFIFPNYEYIDTLLQMELGLKLAKKGYEWFCTDLLNNFIKGEN